MGAFATIMPSLLEGAYGSETEAGGVGPLSLLLYFSSNVPMALSAVYKERNFAGSDVHVLYLTQWVSIYQFLFGFALAPLQLIPGVVSQSVSQSASQLLDYSTFLAAATVVVIVVVI